MRKETACEDVGIGRGFAELKQQIRGRCPEEVSWSMRKETACEDVGIGRGFAELKIGDLA